MQEQMKPGAYTALVDLKIRTQMDTQSIVNQVGTYMRGVPFTVYEVYPEKNSIVWGRVSSNTGSGQARFVGLRVANQDKAHLEEAFDEQPKIDLASSNVILANAINDLSRILEAKLK